MSGVYHGLSYLRPESPTDPSRCGPRLTVSLGEHGAAPVGHGQAWDRAGGEHGATPVSLERRGAAPVRLGEHGAAPVGLGQAWGRAGGEQGPRRRALGRR